MLPFNLLITCWIPEMLYESTWLNLQGLGVNNDA